MRDIEKTVKTNLNQTQERYRINIKCKCLVKHEYENDYDYDGVLLYVLYYEICIHFLVSAENNSFICFGPQLNL